MILIIKILLLSLLIKWTNLFPYEKYILWSGTNINTIFHKFYFSIWSIVVKGHISVRLNRNKTLLYSNRWPFHGTTLVPSPWMPVSTLKGTVILRTRKQAGVYLNHRSVLWWHLDSFPKCYFFFLLMLRRQ